MTEKTGEEMREWVFFWCEHCQIKIRRHVFWQLCYCPVCARELVVRVERKEVIDAQEKKPIAKG